MGSVWRGWVYRHTEAFEEGQVRLWEGQVGLWVVCKQMRGG